MLARESQQLPVLIAAARPLQPGTCYRISGPYLSLFQHPSIEEHTGQQQQSTKHARNDNRQ